MQLWRVGPCSSFWVEYGNIHSKYSQRGWKGTHFALYALHHAVSFMYFHSKHTQEQNRKKTEKQCNWINYLSTWKHKPFTTKDYRSGDLYSTELLILKQMSAAALWELKDWNIKRKKKKKRIKPATLSCYFECTKYNLTPTIWGSRGAIGKCKILQLSTKETKSFASVLHETAIQFRRFLCLQLLGDCSDDTWIITTFLTWQQRKN